MLDFSNNLSEHIKNTTLLDDEIVQDGAKILNGHENGDSNLLKKKIHKYSFEKEKFNNTQTTNRSVRKLCEKAIKTLKIKMSDFSAQIEEDKQVVKDWLKKKLEKSELLDQVTQKGKFWLINYMANLDYQKYFEIAQKYLKNEELEFNINVLKKNPQEKQFYEFPLAVTLANQPPGNQLEDNYEENLGLIDIKIPLQYILREPERFIQEQFIWDLDSSCEVGDNFKNLTILILDFLNEIYPQQLKQATTNEILATVEICYLQLHYALENQRRVKQSWDQLLRSDYEREQEDIHLDGVIPIKIQIQRKYKETILWDTNNNLNFADNFARGWVYDQGLDSRYALYVSSQIRRQVMKYCEKLLDKLAFLFNDLTEGDNYKLQQEIHSRAFELLKELPSYKNFIINDSQMSISQDLQQYLKKNSEFLPQNIAAILAVNQKEDSHDLFVDIEDVNQTNQNGLIQPNTYLDREIFKQIEQGFLNKEIKS